MKIVRIPALIAAFAALSLNSCTFSEAINDITGAAGKAADGAASLTSSAGTAAGDIEKAEGDIKTIEGDIQTIKADKP